jgi:hypothetical protein
MEVTMSIVVALAILLAAVAYGSHLGSRLRKLKADEDALDATISDLIECSPVGARGA